MVQSSGMGKTKLMQEHTRQQNINDSNDMECRLILSIGRMEDVPPNHEKHYHAMLRIKEHGTFTKADEYDITHQLAQIERTCKKDKVIFFFDEAQKLIPEQRVDPTIRFSGGCGKAVIPEHMWAFLRGHCLGFPNTRSCTLDLVSREMLYKVT